MLPMISPRCMRQCEEAFFRAGGVPSIDVMERAARALADVIAAELPAGSRIDFACGPGGNGGDGLACARMLHGRYRCRVLLTKPPTHPDAIENLRRARAAGVPVIEMTDLEGPADATFAQVSPRSENSAGSPRGCWDDPRADRPDAWVDALFGTGLSRAPQGAAARLIERICRDRAAGARVYAADIPSGLNGATGEALQPCVAADRTVTFHMLKTGLKLGDGLDACGEITVADVGFPAAQFSEEAQWIEPRDARLPERPRNIHKGLCGHLLIVAGSFGMAGAAALCASAALRSGAGLVTIACPRSIVPILQTVAPGAMCVPLPERDGAISAEATEALRDALKGKSAAAVGCGLSRSAAPEIVEAVLSADLPAVVDADALNLIAEHPRMLGLLRSRHVLTPHPGEARRLLEAARIASAARDCPAPVLAHCAGIGQGAASEISADAEKTIDTLLRDPIAAAQALHELGGTALFKGAACVVAGASERYVSSSGCCGMARGGSGDILAGIMGALLAERSERSPALSAALASELHGRAGELAMEKYGSRAMNARDILEFLPEAFLGK